MNLIGREKEIEEIRSCLESPRPEFLLIYGRRRVGKTYLIKEFFNNRFSFYATGVPDDSMKGQLRAFNEELIRHGAREKAVPENWLEAFRRLRNLLESESVYREAESGRRVIFLDEMPWMATAKSDFKMALDLFWNGWASSQRDLLLIVCGSAASWIIENIIEDTGGFYNRITRKIHLMPFSLRECDKILNTGAFEVTKKQVMEYYMIFGGIPYYINMFDHRLSVAQNVDKLLFNENGLLHTEYEMLFKSLFKKRADKHIKTLEVIAGRKSGVTREEIIKKLNLKSGAALTMVLKELEQCGFIRKYNDFRTNDKGHLFQVIDPFVLFAVRFMNDKNVSSWMDYYKSPSYNSWAGNAFEILCLNHVDQIKNAMGILGVGSNQYSWRSKNSKPGAQIDLLIDRRDDIINICEMKYSEDEFAIDAEYEKNLINKMEVFRKETGTKKALHVTMITSNGLKHNSHWQVAANEVIAEQLFLGI